MTSPLHLTQTERDRERFRDMTKAMGLRLEYARFGRNEDYRDVITEMAWKIWWAQERERQLLQNLNQSQGAEISRLLSKIKQLEAL